MGYGFVQFKLPSMVQTALKELQHSKLDKHILELKLSERTSNRYVHFVSCLLLLRVLSNQGIIDMNRNGNFCEGTGIFKIVARA